MHMSPKAICRILKEKGVTHLYHANSVVTACAFLKERRLLSRGTMERDKFPLSNQRSDSQDKIYGIWFDIFTDPVDIHQRVKSYNVYGPVLFKINIDILKSGNTGKIWITKKNPIYWANVSSADRWFKNKTDVENSFNFGKNYSDLGQMIIFRHCGGELPLGEYVEEIILDDPWYNWEVNHPKDNIDSYSMAYGALTYAMEIGNLKIPIKKRICQNTCKCRVDYSKEPDLIEKMFFPSI